MKKEFVYLTFGTVSECSVFKTQIIDFLNSLGTNGIKMRLFVLLHRKHLFNKAIRSDREYIHRHFDGQVRFMFCDVHHSITVGLTALMLYFRLLPLILRGTQIYVHCRGEIPAIVAIALKKMAPRVVVVFDKRGIIEEEHLYEIRRASGDAALTDDTAGFFRRLEQDALDGYDRMLCVSGNMKQYVAEKWGLKPAAAEDIDVVPCCADMDIFDFSQEKREMLRSKLGIKDRKVFVYSGSLYGWQMFDVIVDIFEMLHRRDKDMHLLVCTRDKDLSVLQKLPEGSYSVVSARSEEMYMYYSAADYGVILREKSIVNFVSSPVKIGEYTACRLPFIATDGIGDVREVFGDCSEVLLLPSPETMMDIPAACDAIEDFVAQCSGRRMDEACRKHFDRQQYIGTYKKIYGL